VSLAVTLSLNEVKEKGLMEILRSLRSLRMTEREVVEQFNTGVMR